MGLVGGMARTAVVAGTATAVSNRVSRRQANRWAADQQQQVEHEAYQQQQYQQQYAPPPPQPAYAPPPAAGGDMDDKIEKLKQLGELRDSGILTDAEFEAQKAKILAGGGLAVRTGTAPRDGEGLFSCVPLRNAQQGSGHLPPGGPGR